MVENSVAIGYNKQIKRWKGEGTWERKAAAVRTEPGQGIKRRAAALEYQKYIKENELNLFGTKLVELPEPEFYVVYCGPAQRAIARSLRGARAEGFARGCAKRRRKRLAAIRMFIETWQGFDKSYAETAYRMEKRFHLNSKTVDRYMAKYCRNTGN